MHGNDYIDSLRDALAVEQAVSKNLADQIYENRVLRDEAISKLATARREERERIAQELWELGVPNDHIFIKTVRNLTDEG